jgi:hypothetical protein
MRVGWQREPDAPLQLAFEDQCGGMRKGGSAPLAGGVGPHASASAFCWRATCPPTWGEPARPGFPREGKQGRSKTFKMSG